jgi:hypothetical protein
MYSWKFSRSLSSCGHHPGHEGAGSDYDKRRREVRLDAGKAERFSAPRQSTTVSTGTCPDTMRDLSLPETRKAITLSLVMPESAKYRHISNINMGGKARMAQGSSKSESLTVHPTIKKLVGDQSGLAKVLTLKGYIGPSSSQDRVTLFPSLDDLSLSFELARADVLAVEDAPESQLPNGGKVIWVKSDAVITRRNTRTAQEHVEMRKGRLSITITRHVVESDNCATGSLDCKPQKEPCFTCITSGPPPLNRR